MTLDMSVRPGLWQSDRRVTPLAVAIFSVPVLVGLTLLLAYFKAAGVDMSWWAVTAPLWATWAALWVVSVVMLFALLLVVPRR